MPAQPPNGVVSKSNGHCVDAASSKVRLPRSMGLLDSVAMVTGIVVGSGIFVSPSAVLTDVNSIGGALIIWLGCGLMAMIGGLCYVELATMIKSSGGDYAYITAAFGHFWAFLYLWVIVTIVLPAAIAILSMTFAHYLLQVFYMDCPALVPKYAVQLIGLACVAFIVFLNSMSVHSANAMTIFFTGTKTLALLSIIVLGGYYSLTGRSILMVAAAGKDEKVFDWDTIWGDEPFDPAKFALAFYSGMFSYAGWNSVTYVTEEIKNPSRNLKYAIIISLSLVTVLYFLVNVCYFSVLTIDEFKEATAAAVVFGGKIYDPAKWVFALMVMCSTFGAINGAVFGTSRLLYVGARDGILPDVFAYINIYRMTPVVSLITLGLLSSGYIIAGGRTVNRLIILESFVELLFINVTIIGLLHLRRRHPEWERPFKVPLILPVFYLVTCAVVMTVMVFSETLQCLLGLALVAFGVPVYLLLTRCRDLDASWIVLRIQKMLMCVPEDGQSPAPKVRSVIEFGNQFPTGNPTPTSSHRSFKLDTNGL